MSNVSAAAVKSLRDRTNAPMMDCKAALTEAGGDMDKAIELLRKKNASIQAKKGDRETAEGRVAVFVDPEKKLAAIVEMRCESPPVVKSEHFIALCNEIAKQVAYNGPANVEALLAQPSLADPKKTVNDRIGEVIGLIRENMKPARFVQVKGLAGAYPHHDGSVGVLIQVEGDKADPQMLREVCMHIAAKNPVAMSREEVSTDTIEKEKEIAKSQAAATGKPAAILERIAEGKIKTWFAENVLLEQPFVKDDSKTVGELLKSGGIKPVRFIRYKVGELT